MTAPGALQEPSATGGPAAVPAPAGEGRRRGLRGPRDDRFRRGLVVQAARVALIFLILAVWELAARTELVDPFFTSMPTAVVETLVELAGSADLWQNVLATTQATLIGFAIGAVLGVALGLIFGSSPFVDRVASPIMALGNGMPRIALAPLFVLWFGLSMWAKVWLAVSLVLFILVYNTKGGLATVDDDHVVMSRMLDMKRRERFQKILLPTCMPAIMAGLRIGVVFSLLGVVASEMVAANDGLGLLIVEASTTFQVDRLMALILVVSMLSVLINGCLDLIERRTVRWKEEK